MFGQTFYPGMCDGQTSATIYGRASQWEAGLLAVGTGKRTGQRYWVAKCVSEVAHQFLVRDLLLCGDPVLDPVAAAGAPVVVLGCLRPHRVCKQEADALY
jgi:hypothetical protein